MNRTQEVIEQTYHLSHCGCTMEDIVQLFKMARALHKIHERQCNGYRDDKSEIRDNKRESKIENALRIMGVGLSITYDVRFYVQGDARGAPIKVIKENREFSVWG